MKGNKFEFQFKRIGIDEGIEKSLKQAADTYGKEGFTLDQIFAYNRYILLVFSRLLDD